jgi:hypothetical protein
LKVVQHGRQYAVNIRKTTNKGWGMAVNGFVLWILNPSYRHLRWETKDSQRLIYWCLCG